MQVLAAGIPATAGHMVPTATHVPCAPFGAQQPLAQRAPGQHGPPGTPHLLQVAAPVGARVQSASGSEQAATPAMPAQQG
jgi:hypothetical protein